MAAGVTMVLTAWLGSMFIYAAGGELVAPVTLARAVMITGTAAALWFMGDPANTLDPIAAVSAGVLALAPGAVAFVRHRRVHRMRAQQRVAHAAEVARLQSFVSLRAADRGGDTRSRARPQSAVGGGQAAATGAK